MATEYDEIVEVTVDQQTTALAEPSFSIPAVISEFDEAIITGWIVGQRAKYYASTAEMVTDGFPADHMAVVALGAFMSQTPKTVEKVLIGREDTADANIDATMTAITGEQPEFYDTHYKYEQSSLALFDLEFVADNSIIISILTSGGVLTAIPAVPFNTDNSTTYDDIKAAIELAIADATVTVDEAAKTVLVEITGRQVLSITSVVTGGAITLAEMTGDFITGNSIAINVIYGTLGNPDVVVPEVIVPFDTDDATTYANIKTDLEAAIAGSVVDVDDVANDFTITMALQDRITITVLVTGGVSQVTATYTVNSPATNTSSVTPITVAQDLKYRQLGAWAQANERIHGYVTAVSSASSAPYDPGLGVQPDLGAYFKSVNQERNYGYFDKESPISELDTSSAGENLPYGPPADGVLNTWSFKTPKGVTTKPYSTSERNNLESKGYNVFVTKRGTALTLFNYTAVAGQPIEAVINIDWMVFLFQRNIFTLLLNKRAVPLNDNGMLTIIGQVAEAVDEGESKGALVPGESTITYPKYADLPEADRNAGIFSGIVVESKIQRATQKVLIRFIITA